MYATVSEGRRPVALLALVFAGVYTTVLGGAYWLQLTNVPWTILRSDGDGVAPWVVWNPASFFWRLETFAYFAMGISCALAALAHEPGVLPRRVRRGLLAMGPLGAYFLGTALKDVVLNAEGTWVTLWSLSAFIAWVVLFSGVAFSLVGWFGRQDPDGSVVVVEAGRSALPKPWKARRPAAPGEVASRRRLGRPRDR